jgi:hypothetical protein
LISALRNSLNDDVTKPHLLLPILLLDLSIDALTREVELRRTALLRICHSIGTHGFHNDDTTTGDECRHNISELTRKLAGLSDACAGIGAVTTTLERFIDAVNELSKIDGHSNPWHEELKFVSSMLQGVKSKMAYVTESSQAQSQTMCSLIAQDDNAIHSRYANLSSRIADHSQKIAEFTRRDSKDMRSVSVLMMAFFPATFLAVCCLYNNRTLILTIDTDFIFIIILQFSAARR